MFCTILVFGLSAILAVTPIQGSFAPQGRMTGGSSVDTLRRFPHHVLIKDYNNNFNQDYETEERFCGGSIVNQRWILTAASCCKHFDVLEICFQRLYLTKSNGSYSAVVNRDAVHEYPTQYDNIALIELPFTLDFSDTVQPVEMYSGPNIDAGQFVVLPGYDNSPSYDFQTTTTWPTTTTTTTTPSSTTDWPTTPSSTTDWPTTAWPAEQNFRLNSNNTMVYGMFSVLSAAACKADLNNDFDEYLQYCTRPWSNTRNSPSTLDIGSGLLSGWPARTQLVGIYTGSNSWNNVAIYTNVAKYLTWIRGVINDIPS